MKAFNLLSSLIPFGVSFKLLEISLLYCSSIVFLASNIILKITSTKEKINLDNNDDYINVVSKDEKSKNDYLKGVNNKIKILDFMKNATIDEELGAEDDEKTEKEVQNEIVIF